MAIDDVLIHKTKIFPLLLATRERVARLRDMPEKNKFLFIIEGKDMLEEWDKRELPFIYSVRTTEEHVLYSPLEEKQLVFFLHFFGEFFSYIKEKEEGDEEYAKQCFSFLTTHYFKGQEIDREKLFFEAFEIKK